MWQYQIVKGKDWPRDPDEKEFASLGAKVVFMLRMCHPIFRTGNAVVLDSEFVFGKGNY